MAIQATNSESSSSSSSEAYIPQEVEVKDPFFHVKQFAEGFPGPIQGELTLRTLLFDTLMRVLHYLDDQDRSKKFPEQFLWQGASILDVVADTTRSFHQLDTHKDPRDLIRILKKAIPLFPKQIQNISNVVTALNSLVVALQENDLIFLSSKAKMFHPAVEYPKAEFLSIRISARAHKQLMLAVGKMFQSVSADAQKLLDTEIIKQNRIDCDLDQMLDNNVLWASIIERGVPHVDELHDLYIEIYNDMRAHLDRFQMIFMSVADGELGKHYCPLLDSESYKDFCAKLDSVDPGYVNHIVTTLKPFAETVNFVRETFVYNAVEIEKKAKRLQYFFLYLLCGDITKVPRLDSVKIKNRSRFFVFFNKKVTALIEEFEGNNKKYQSNIFTIMRIFPDVWHVCKFHMLYRNFYRNFAHLVIGALDAPLAEARGLTKALTKVPIPKPLPIPAAPSLPGPPLKVHEIESLLVQTLEALSEKVLQEDSLQNAISQLKDCFSLVSGQHKYIGNGPVTRARSFVYHQQLSMHLALFVERLIASNVPKDKDLSHDLISLRFASRSQDGFVLNEEELEFLNEMNGLELFARKVGLKEHDEKNSGLRQLLDESYSGAGNEKKHAIQLHNAFAKTLHFIQRYYAPHDLPLEREIGRYIRFINRPHVDAKIEKSKKREDSLTRLLKPLHSLRLSIRAENMRNNLFNNHLVQLQVIQQGFSDCDPKRLKVTLGAVVQISQYILEDLLYILASHKKIRIDPAKVKHDLMILVQQVGIPMDIFNEEERTFLERGKASRFSARYLERSKMKDPRLKPLEDILHLAKQVSEADEASSDDISSIRAFILNEIKLLKGVVQKAIS